MGWKRSKSYGFTRYTWEGGERKIRISESVCYVRRSAGWGHRAGRTKKRCWLIHDITDKQKPVGSAGGYLLLKRAKAIAQELIEKS